MRERSRRGARTRILQLVFVLPLVALLLIGERAMSDSTQGRVLILGGGGPIGEAWESGIIVGLADKGVELSKADRIIGTSAGSIVGARLALRLPQAQFIADALAPADDAPPRESPGRKSSPPDLSFLGAKLEEMGTGKRPRQTIEAEIGKWAQRVHPVVSEAEFVASYQRRFPQSAWPHHTYECVSVDAADGSMRIWNESSEVPLAMAVAASCALPGVFAPVTIDGHRYMDGGVRSVTNADLARGCETALILAPTASLEDPIAKAFTQPLEGEIRSLRDGGCTVELIAPDAASLKAFGPSIGDEHHRAPAFEAGRTQGQGLASAIGKL
jgi:NTE family protein